MESTKELKDLEHDIDLLGNKVHSFKTTRFIIKVIGSLMIIPFLIMGLWIWAFAFWILFLPESEKWVAFFKRIYIKYHTVNEFLKD